MQNEIDSYRLLSMLVFGVETPCGLVQLKQGRRVHVYHVSLANTWKNDSKKSSDLLSRFSGTPYTGTQQKRSDKMHR
jgi:hypothetical protein